MALITRVYRVDPLNPDERALSECSEIVLKGGIVVFPTETVYGLGASAYDSRSVRKIFVAKGRPLDNPLIVHIAKIEQLKQVASEIPKEVWKLIEKVWPGPLTVVLKKSDRIVPEVTAGLETVAVRMPAHPVALRLIELSTPIAAPSANLSGRPSPTSEHHVLLDMFGRVDALILAGDTFLGVESTIISFVHDPPMLLRPGPLPVEKIVEILGIELKIPEFARGFGAADRALAPGTKYRHYAPRTKLVLVESRDVEKMVEEIVRLAEKYLAEGFKVAIIATRETMDRYRDLSVRLLCIGSRNNLYEVAKNLFKTLRELDRLGVDLALVESFEERGIGLAIMNRLRKAASEIVEVP